MRSSLFALLAGSAALASATKDGCTQGDLKELLFSSSCSNLEAISTCLSGADFEQLEELELCFYDAGCETEYAEVGAKWFVSQCNTDEDDQVDELRRRADATTTTEESTTKAASTTAKTTSKTSSTAAASTSATTTSDSSTSSDSTTSSSTTLSTTTSSTTSSTTTSSSTSSTNTCLATSTVSTSACNYFTTSGTKTSTCFATTTATSSCSAGLICSTDTSGADTCMKRDNTLTTSGLIVTIVFSVGIGAFMIAVIVMYAKQNSKQKKEKAEREALLGKTSMMAHNDVEAVGTYSGRNRGASASEANIPLISEPTGANPQYDYFGRDVGAPGASSSSSPNEHPPTIPPVPKLHQGLGALGQD